MKEKLCSLMVILSITLQSFVSVYAGDISSLKNDNQGRQTFLNNIDNPFVAVISSDRNKQVRYQLDGFNTNMTLLVYVWTSDRVRFSIKKSDDRVRSQINRPLLI